MSVESCWGVGKLALIEGEGYTPTPAWAIQMVHKCHSPLSPSMGAKVAMVHYSCLPSWAALTAGFCLHEQDSFTSLRRCPGPAS